MPFWYIGPQKNDQVKVEKYEKNWIFLNIINGYKNFLDGKCC